MTGGIGGDLEYYWEVIGQECFIQTGQGTPEIEIYVGFGEITVKLTVMDEFGCMTMCDTTFDCLNKIEIDNPGISQGGFIDPTGQEPGFQNGAHGQMDVFDSVELWPNPTSDELNLAYRSFDDQEVEIFVTNVLGSIIWTGEMDAVKGMNRKVINVSDWSSGSYLVHVNASDQVVTKIIVVNN